MLFQQKIIKLRDRELGNLHPGQEPFRVAIWFFYGIACILIVLLEALGMQFVWNNYLTIIVPNLIKFDYVEILSFKIFFEIFR